LKAFKKAPQRFKFSLPSVDAAVIPRERELKARKFVEEDYVLQHL
jgi:hypothetical protein